MNLFLSRSTKEMVKILSVIKLVLLLIVVISCDQKSKYWIDFEQNPIGQSSIHVFKDTQEVKSWTLMKSGEEQQLDFHSGEYRTLQGFQLSFSLEQIEAQYFVNKGLTGKGVKIGIIDGGFLDADVKNGLSHVFENNQVKGYKDFLTPNMRKYGGSKGADDGHGTEVWQQIAGLNTIRRVQFGLAPEAEFYLARTDDGRKEYRKEEEYLIEAINWMHEQGVKLVNISLGYSTGYDNPLENYSPEHIDGSYSAITRAAQRAAEKGMLIVVSAGNDGQTDFKVLSVPGDAKGVITVGATNFKTWDKADYSSIAPKNLKYLKPNVSCFSNNGTSFAAPVITGLAACIIQMDSTLTNYEIKRIVEQSSHLYPFGNNHIGYGVPSCRRIISLVEQKEKEPISDGHKTNLVHSRKKKYTIKLPMETGILIVFHKSDTSTVLSQEKFRFQDFQFVLNKPKSVSYTTVVTDNFFREVKWK